MSRHIPDDYSPAGQIQRLFLIPELGEFVSGLHQLAQRYAQQPLELQQHVMDYLTEHEDNFIDSNGIIRNEYRIGDQKLKTFTQQEDL